eukprot:gene16005-17618_t
MEKVSGRKIFKNCKIRDYHNALERRRRRLISGKFELLKDVIPIDVYDSKWSKSDTRVPRCIILKSACNYISILERINHQHKNDIAKIKQENKILEDEIAKLENSPKANKDEFEEEVDNFNTRN